MTSSPPETPGMSKSPSLSSSSPSDNAGAQDQPQPQPQRQPQAQSQAPPPQQQKVGDAIKCPSPDKPPSPLSPADNVQGPRKRGRDNDGPPSSDRDRKGKAKLEDGDPNVITTGQIQAHPSQKAKPLTAEETQLLQQKLAPTLIGIAKDIMFQFDLNVKPPPPKRAMMIDLNLPLSSEEDDDSDYEDSDDEDDDDDEEEDDDDDDEDN